VEYVTGIFLPSFTLVTNKGNKSPKFGFGAGTEKTVIFPENYQRVVGIHGRSANYVDSLGFVLGKTTYPSSEETD
jgi:hypothetical protein